VAHKTGALATRDLQRVMVDTTVQPKAIARPTDARLCHRGLEKLVDLARRHYVPLRQSYSRPDKPDLCRRLRIRAHRKPRHHRGGPQTDRARLSQGSRRLGGFDL
jgi:IS5 family transposase